MEVMNLLDVSSSSSSEVEDEFTSLLLTTAAAITTLASALVGREEHIRQKDFLETLWQKSEEDFFNALRVTKATFSIVLQLINDEYGSSPSSKDLPLGPDNALAVTLWYLGHQLTYTQLSEQFGFELPTVYNCVQKVIRVLTSAAGKFLKWPKGEEVMKVEEEFHQTAGLPNVIGAIDGCHVTIKAPRNSQADYLDHTSKHSVNLMAVCDANMKFTFISAGFPGSADDSTVFKDTDLYRHIRASPKLVFPSTDFHLLGDSEFPLDNYLLVPYMNTGHLTAEQSAFNIKHSRTRAVIENTFAFLKRRFRKLKYIDVDVESVQPIIVACCVLHNITIQSPEEMLLLRCELHEIASDYKQQGVLNRHMEGEAKRARMAESC